MKRIVAVFTVFALFAFNASAQVRELELKKYPDLKPLHECKGANGKIQSQVNPCDPGTEVKDRFRAPSDAHDELDELAKRRPDIKAKLDKLEDRDGASTADKSDPVSQNDSEKQSDEKQLNKQWRKSIMKLLGFGLLLGLLAKLTGRSFIRWSIVGIALHFILVAANIISL